MPIRAFTVSLNPAIDRTLWIDALTPGTIHMATSEHRQAGGKGFNVAAGLASLGLDVGMCGWLGRDNAALFEAAFAERGITDAMDRVAGCVRENLQLTDGARQQTTAIDLPGTRYDAASRAEAEDRLLATLDRCLAPGDWCLMTGSLPPGIDAATSERVARRLGTRGVKLVFDMGGEALGDLLRRLHGAPECMPEFIKPNRSELEALTGRRLPEVGDVVDAARGLVARGVPRVLVSLDVDGAVGVSSEGAWHARVPAVPVCTTVGAGDAVVAGTAAALIEGQGFAEAACFGLACAAWRIQRRLPDLPARAALSPLVAQIHALALPGARAA